MSFEEIRDHTGNVRQVIAEDGNTYPTQIAKRIFEDLVPEWSRQFLNANAGYGEGADLGIKGEFVELHRKTMKLKRAIWEEQFIGKEDVREVAMDMIGHAFLLIALHDYDERGKTDG